MAPSEYRIEDLAQRSGATVRTIRAYQDRRLLPMPERRGRANVYDDTHLARLRQIADLLDRGYTLASIKELLEAWDSGRGLGGVLGLVTEVDGRWNGGEPSRLTRAELNELFGGTYDDEAVAAAVSLGVLVPVPDTEDEEYVAPSSQELAVAAELHAAGVPLAAISGRMRELRTRVEHVAERFLDVADEGVFIRHLGGGGRERGRGEGGGRGGAPTEALQLPAATLASVRALVGADHVASFIAAAAEREVAARTMDRLAGTCDGKETSAHE